jgi:hypothetical protein
LVAHVDTVHSIIEDFHIFQDGDTLFAFDDKKRKQCGIGGDDKVGVYILLQALLDVPVLKTVFYRNEEIGRIGSRYSILNHRDWYKDCNFVIEPDREGFYDLITNSGGIDIAGSEYLEETQEIADKYEYIDTIGICSDIDVLTAGGIGISCLNLSCGYVNSHTSQEIVSIAGVNACYNYIWDIVDEYAHRKFTYNAPAKPIYKGYTKDGNYYNSLFKNRKEKIEHEQGKLFGPAPLISDISLYSTKLTYDNFALAGETKSKQKLYKYIGIKAVPFTVDVCCNECKEYRTLFYMPYEGRIFCTKCNDYAINEDDLNLFKSLEVDDNDMTFVFSVYADSWMEKSSSVWNDKFMCWVSDDMPF